jgi:hypothetical protein
VVAEVGWSSASSVVQGAGRRCLAALQGGKGGDLYTVGGDLSDSGRRPGEEMRARLRGEEGNERERAEEGMRRREGRGSWSGSWG